jgi:hypothetical protein
MVNGKDLNYGQIHDMMHRDSSIGNDYRKERIKLQTTLATGVFAVTAIFNRELFGLTLTRTGLWLLLLGWASLIISLLAGIVHFKKWEDFYLAHRAQGNALWRYHAAGAAADERKQARIAFHRAGEKIEYLQESYKKWNHIQSGGLIIGLVLIAYVVITGLDLTQQSKTDAGARATGQASSALPK